MHLLHEAESSYLYLYELEGPSNQSLVMVCVVDLNGWDKTTVITDGVLVGAAVVFDAESLHIDELFSTAVVLVPLLDVHSVLMVASLLELSPTSVGTTPPMVVILSVHDVLHE